MEIMIRFAKFAVAIGVLAICLAFVAESSASVYVVPDPVNTTYSTSLLSWASSGSTSVDGVPSSKTRLWTFGSSTFDPSVGAAFSMYQTPLVSPTQDHHEVEFAPTGRMVGPGTFTTDFTIQINQLPANSFLSAEIGADTNQGDTPTSVSETLYLNHRATPYGAGLLYSDASPQVLSVALPAGTTYISVVDTLVIGTNANFNNFSNTFVESLDTPAVPEPSTLIVWSLLGGLGLAVAWWRRKHGLGPSASDRPANMRVSRTFRQTPSMPPARCRGCRRVGRVSWRGRHP